MSNNTANNASQQMNIYRQAMARASLYERSTGFMETRFGTTQIRGPVRPSEPVFILDGHEEFAPEEVFADELRDALERHNENPTAARHVIASHRQIEARIFGRRE